MKNRILICAIATIVMLDGCQKNIQDNFIDFYSSFPVYIVDKDGNDLLDPGNAHYIKSISVHLINDSNYQLYTDSKEKDLLVDVEKSVVNYAKDAIRNGQQSVISEWLGKCPYTMYNCIFPFGPLNCVKEAVISYDNPDFEPDLVTFEMFNDGNSVPFVKHVTLNGIPDERIVYYHGFPDFYLAIVK